MLQEPALQEFLQVLRIVLSNESYTVKFSKFLHDRPARKNRTTLRRAALMQKVPYYTTMAGSLSAARAIAALRAGNLEVKPLQAYF